MNFDELVPKIFTHNPDDSPPVILGMKAADGSPLDEMILFNTLQRLLIEGIKHLFGQDGRVTIDLTKMQPFHLDLLHKCMRRINFDFVIRETKDTPNHKLALPLGDPRTLVLPNSRTDPNPLMIQFIPIFPENTNPSKGALVEELV